MNFEQGGNNKEKVRKAGTHIGAFLAGALAMYAVTGGDDQKSPEYTPLQNNAADSYTPDSYLSGVSYETADYSSTEFPASADATSTIDLLNIELGPKINVPPQQIAQIRESIRTYVDAHPPIEGKVTTSPNGTDSSQSSSYDPYSDLLFAALQNPQMNPALLGVLQSELSDARKLNRSK